MPEQNYNSPMLKEYSLEGKVILITGGGTGLGKAMGKYFSELGAGLIITSRKLEVYSQKQPKKFRMQKKMKSFLFNVMYPITNKWKNY